MVFWSAYSRSEPMGRPRARRVMRTPNGVSCWRKYSAVASPSMLGLSLGLVIFSTVLPYGLYTIGLARVQASQASIAASFEPVVAAVTGIFMFGEAMDLFTFMGIGCVIAGICVLNCRRKSS